MAGQPPTLVYACAPWEIDVARRELRSRGTPVVLGSRAFEIVEVLARAGGQLVTKDDLMERIWPGAVVGENTLHVHIAALRKALGSDRNLLKTTPGRGYRLLGGWTAQHGKAEAASTMAAPPPPAPLPERPVTNFPVIVTQLIGRSAAVERVRDLLSAYRVVTLTGAGGIGKTVLAMKAVRGLLGEFEHGAWLVELASLSDPALAAAAVASALDLRLGGERITPESLARAIGDRHFLLVLDNCEHLIDAVAILVETVARLCPRAAILATSREVMRIDGEAVFRVPALEVPAAGSAAADTLLDHSAVALFVARAKALEASFAPEAQDLQAIAEICRHLDGIPLAIEFAAARAAYVGTAQVAAGLRDRFALLTSGRRTAIPQHRTLRAALDWSYQLLSAQEQRLLRHLAVFPAGFALEAVHAVAGLGRAEHSVIEDLSSLVSKSLCERVGTATPTRWRLLESIRAYAAEKLAEAGEHPDAARRHAAYFRDFVAATTAGTRIALNRDDVARCAGELDNVRAALDWAFARDGDAEIGVGLTVAFAPIWLMLSLVGECRERVERMLATQPADLEVSQTPAWRMWIAYGHALTMTFAPVERARGVVRKAVDLTAAVDDVELQAGVRYTQWSIDFMSGAYATALREARELVAVTPRGDDAIRLAGDRILGTSLLFSGALADAQVHLQRVVDRYAPPSGGHHSALFVYDQQVLSRVRLARVLCLRGCLERASAEARTSLETARASGAGLTVCWTLQDAVCPIALMTGDLATAESAIAAMHDWATRMDATLWKMMAACWSGRLLIERGDFALGIELIAPTLDACEQSGWQMGYVEFLGCLADGLAGLGRLDEAGATLERAIAAADRTGEAWYHAELLRRKGALLLRHTNSARTVEAEDCFRAAADLARRQDALFFELRIALSLAGLHIAQGRPDDAKALVAPVYARFTEGFDAPMLRDARALLGVA